MNSKGMKKKEVIMNYLNSMEKTKVYVYYHVI